MDKEKSSKYISFSLEYYRTQRRRETGRFFNMNLNDLSSRESLVYMIESQFNKDEQIIEIGNLNESISKYVKIIGNKISQL